jgi:uncharacterized NAD(P)/FAD-binding protein YdhS
MSPKNHIAIVGGGFSGCLVFIQLLNKLTIPTKITLVNSSHSLGRGIAYSTNNLSHLLNVRTARMSAFPDDANHFINWILSKNELSQYHTNDLPELFVPRTIYGKYIEELFDQAISSKKDFIETSIIEDEVIDIEKLANGFELHLKNSAPVKADKVALCTGIQPPTSIPGARSLKDDERVFINPWDNQSTENINTDAPILIVGSSLTAADTILSLQDNNFKGKIYLLSRHGGIPLAHPVVRPPHEHSDYKPEADIHKILVHLKTKIRSSFNDTQWHEPVLEEIRPHTQLIWQKLSRQQKERFLRHLNHKWSLLRHRLPCQIHAKLHELIDSGKMSLFAGTIDNINLENDLIEVTWKSRKDHSINSLKVQRVINCTGPESNIEKGQNNLLTNLLKRNLIEADELKLGIHATADGKILVGDNVIDNLFVMGINLKSTLWESTAVPELRKQTEELAELLLKD